ncbi:hypothetical protein SYNTR_0523 [Candidatus Syntrophocurvum alkaliphilum]|uniref:ABC transmembrane type-1 domain-containing protein n=1 Tax=Candidatus Syntrophocurvum alkaliphilum TaxID=2293317 RepID=A0A6I6D7N3_9FIRM|nr:ABC transporter permease subunit [Candidatus Syntrophocurvum alkaliphilum]QGT99116.1 hypothetical protein SYNTR_0523 [Candidatus Syntrophocurvum alkaliphilum]
MIQFLRSLVGIAVFIAIWYLTAFILDEAIILPPPNEVFGIFFNLFFDNTIIMAAFHTIWKVVLTLVIVMFFGVLVGLILGMFTPLYDMFRPIILIIQAVPVVSWLSLVIFAWGIGWKGPVFIAVLSLLPIAILTTVAGVKSLDNRLIEVAKVYRVPFKTVFKDIYLGSLVPFIIAVVDVTIGQAWKVILVAEYLAGNNGLGVLILAARWEVNIPQVYALTLIAVIIGLIAERLIKIGLRRLSLRWVPA